ncbi:DUF58 domain-containing protein [Dyadobacter subterraneus]|uniref:DUF58 domain-containing protein n=1 Tax=Dyadobacter subterraneus TaxID=2773304 RepID=UPI001D166611|nr:DUF58 domain-containing protein [Dyadobacter subterraneus]
MSQKRTGLLASDLIKLGNLQLVGKLISEELMLGVHASKRSGMGTEFEQYRHYEPGDDPKRIDWKLYARTDKHLVKESSAESNRQIRFLLDLSGSMNYAENGMSRLEYAKLLIASLSYLGYIQNDQMSLYALQNGKVNSIVSGASSSGKQAFNKILFGLQKTTASGEWTADFAANGKLQFPEFATKSQEQLIFVTDFLQVGQEWLTLIKSIASPRREIVIFQILGDNEVDFNLTGFYRFKDLETGKEIELQAEAVRDKFKESSKAYFDMLEEELRIPYVNLVQARLSDPLGMVLKEFLTRRKG